ncbi:30S ribosomal protein S6 [candidate division GN15 bacterium]|nr:30S ribosomal protein S6 [candidate division GN15 bacterium]
MVRTYETTFIVNPQADDATIDRQVRAVTDLITGNGGEIVHEDRIGTRRMAYEVAGLTQGFYASIIHKSETSVLPQLDRHFKLEEPYIRYMTIVYEGDIERLKGDRDQAPERAARPTGKPETKPETKPEAKPEAKAEEKTEAKAEEKTEPEPEKEATVTKSEAPRAGEADTVEATAETPAESEESDKTKQPPADEEL